MSQRQWQWPFCHLTRFITVCSREYFGPVHCLAPRRSSGKVVESGNSLLAGFSSTEAFYQGANKTCASSNLRGCHQPCCDCMDWLPFSCTVSHGDTIEHTDPDRSPKRWCHYCISLKMTPSWQESYWSSCKLIISAEWRSLMLVDCASARSLEEGRVLLSDVKADDRSAGPRRICVILQMPDQGILGAEMRPSFCQKPVITWAEHRAVWLSLCFERGACALCDRIRIQRADTTTNNKTSLKFWVALQIAFAQKICIPAFISSAQQNWTQYTG